MENTNKKTAICKVGTGYSGGTIAISRAIGMKGSTVKSYQRNYLGRR